MLSQKQLDEIYAMPHPPMQERLEINWLLSRLGVYFATSIYKSEEPRNCFEPNHLETILEIGVCMGGGLKVWEQILPKSGLLIGVDVDPHVQWDISKSTRRIKITQGMTQDESTYQKVKEALDGTKVDFLWIDASHEPWATKKEFEWYGGLVRDYGVIGLHDTRLFRSWWNELTGSENATHPPGNKAEKDIFWKEEYKTAMGVGLFYKLPNQSLMKFREG